MSISLLLEMAVSQDPDRVAVVCDQTRCTTAELSALADGGAGLIAASGAQSVAYVGMGGDMLPLLLFAAARAGVPCAPLNYRLSAPALHELIDRLPQPLVVVDAEYRGVLADRLAGNAVLDSAEFRTEARTTEPVNAWPDADDVAVVLFTSGTTSQPKAVELSHNNLTSYVTGTVEFASADPQDAALICVPPYHIAGVGAALTNLYAGRRSVYLRKFDPAEWIRLVNAESVTTATVVPTMLDRIVAELERHPRAMPSLRNLAYGGSKVALPLVRQALDLMPEVGFVNAYGLTETSSTVTVLTPDDHRLAHRSTDEAVRRRLGSVGRTVPGIEAVVRDGDGRPLPAGAAGELFVRGEQVSGRYSGIGSVLDPDGWFATRDIAVVDDEGYVFIVGRSDDTIIRGGENIAPAEIEDVLVEHPQVRQVAVVGSEDAQWGQIIVAVVVAEPGAAPDPEALRDFARRSLRGSRTPDRIVFRDELPTTPTGKVLRRELVAALDNELQDANAERTP
ncbi:long-chain fatty acid--CoA ligase [Mycolicibacillus parakoreensis]|uniref:Fatty acid--CoA ligase family protein n=2 Tax=Mycobacteriaceae TaxID=1762 RepID=A0ABY3U059_9MYCO|nr:fatty acid--CoA ligase family protein [Mycolicibacillus parakoreensis]MCV7316949.1 long-chain fatty acid--CoA ligase [Mycolicibacillus parakoreensis]ULN51295.1 fatty acid--CoA ligase family protein [Mycolicibacillus parakoreensis]